MDILFITISPIEHMSKPSISQDLLRELERLGHNIYVLCAASKDKNLTNISVESGCNILRVKIGKNKKANFIEKGLTTLLLPYKYIQAIKRFYSNVKFDLVLFSTPPITHFKTISFIKKRDNAFTYLLLKDIFPQNAVDIEILSKKGIKGIIYNYFRKKEEDLYSISDKIGCMSQGNIDYILQNNKFIDSDKLEVFPNSIEVVDVIVSKTEKKELKTKYGIPVDKKVFVYGGNLGKPQGIDFLIDCLDKIEEIEGIHFLIVGDGTEYNRLNAYIKSNNLLNTTILKRIPREEYDKMISICDVGLIFLDSRFTIPNFPSRLLAYLQAKLPVLAATDSVTDLKDVLVNNNIGWWCESRDSQQFCDLVMKIRDNTQLSQIGEKGFKYLLEHYQVRKNVKVIIDSYENSIGKDSISRKRDEY